MAEKGTGRVEAFSDGVFAVAITLLALDIHVPKLDPAHPGGLGAALLHQWPPLLLAYAISFLTVLVMWMNHHRLFQYIERTDHGLLLRNGLLLMVVTLFPVPTALLAEYIQQPGSGKVAAAVYSAFSIAMAVSFNLLWHHAADGERLLADGHDRGRAQRITEQYRLGPLLYAVAFAAAFFNAYVSVGLSLALAVFFALPERPPRPNSGEPEIG